MTNAAHFLRRLGVVAFLLLGGALPAFAEGAAGPAAAPAATAPAEAAPAAAPVATAPPEAPPVPATPGIVQVPRNWQIGFQAPGSPVQVRIEHLNTLIFWIITAITLFVAGLLAYVVWRYRASVHPQASRTSHHTWLEVAWTVMPALLLVVIAIPSFRLVYYEDRAANPDMTIKVTGHQWYWNYEYPDQGNLQFDSRMVEDTDLQPGQLRHLSVDNPVVLPVGKSVRILQTSEDVIHSFFIPALGVQRYAIPGRMIETWVRVDKPGTYYGECNQICGTNHSVMPIEVRALTQPDFDAWVEYAKKNLTADAAPPATGGTRLAAVVR